MTKLPNLLTLSRIIALFVIAALLFVDIEGANIAAFVLFILAAITDWLDGYYARKMKLVSDFGKFMDALADKVLMVGIFICLLTDDGYLPDWSVFAVLIIITREFLITGLRLIAANKGKVLAAEKAGKFKTVIQIISASIFLLHLAMIKDLNLNGDIPSFVYNVGIASLILATVLTATSGIGYMQRNASLLND